MKAINNTRELAAMSLSPITQAITQAIKRFYLRRKYSHYVICAEVERNRARDANLNAAHYEKAAMLIAPHLRR